MSRTYKDAPYWVKASKLKNLVPEHYYCEFSRKGGRWLHTSTEIHHGPEWHLVTLCRDPYKVECAHTWLSFDALVEHIKDYHKLTQWNAKCLVQSSVTAQRWVYGEWTETVTAREFVTRECDLSDVPSATGGGYWRACRWEPRHWADVPCSHPTWGEMCRTANRESRHSMSQQLNAIKLQYNTDPSASDSLDVDPFALSRVW